MRAHKYNPEYCTYKVNISDKDNKFLQHSNKNLKQNPTIKNLNASNLYHCFPNTLHTINYNIKHYKSRTFQSYLVLPVGWKTG